MFALDRRRCPAGTVAALPNERLHGLRALDMSGIRVDGVFVPEDALVGAEGQGLELALKSAQVARVVIGSIALGAVDTALRLTMDFAARGGRSSGSGSPTSPTPGASWPSASPT